MTLFPSQHLEFFCTKTASEITEAVAGLIGQTTFTDSLLGIVHFPFKGTVDEAGFHLRLARNSRLPLPFPRIVGTIQGRGAETTVRVVIAPDPSSNLFITAWVLFCLGATTLILSSWLSHREAINTHALATLVIPVSLLAFGVAGYHDAFKIGASEATSALASILGNPGVCPA